MIVCNKCGYKDPLKYYEGPIFIKLEDYATTNRFLQSRDHICDSCLKNLMKQLDDFTEKWTNPS